MSSVLNPRSIPGDKSRVDKLQLNNISYVFKNELFFLKGMGQQTPAICCGSAICCGRLSKENYRPPTSTAIPTAPGPRIYRINCDKLLDRRNGFTYRLLAKKQLIINGLIDV